MSKPAIEVTGLSKRYVIQHESRHDNLRDTLHHSARKLWRKFRWGTGFESEEFWALQDVSFSIQPGEVLGIIGRNGAGKSTLLKILSRITEPTAGAIKLRGRVASLLEVGTGFHPDLTGRENIYLNGAILGMSRTEIRRKFDEIVAFAEVERFLDTPVKRYSSGMYVRLAFAVAAHLEPEILIVDEVLAVGDAQFQQKCLGKMESISRTGGRTVLFVSHNLNAVRQLTTQCLYLQHGKVAFWGPTRQGLDIYASAIDSKQSSGKGKHSSIIEAYLTDETGFRLPAHNGKPVIWIESIVETDGTALSSIECFLTDLEGTRLGLYSPGHFTSWRFPASAGRWRCRLPLAVPPLASGNYGLDICTTVHGKGPDHYIPNAIVIESSSLTNFPAKWELRKEYASGYFILDAGDPELKSIASPNP
jgi:ABC-type polysaccharide/polyol phosphate transport system ATPase subunit